MPGVPRELAEHTLNVDPKFKPVRQFLRQFNKERCNAIGEEVARLLAAGFIVEFFHPEWLANLVLVLKKNGTWRMCADYTNLNKACPADPFALPRIDQIIDATAGCERLIFLDAYSGYHQIKMVVKYQEKKLLSLPLECSAICLCLLGSRVPRRLTNGVFIIASMARLGAMFMLMWMILL